MKAENDLSYSVECVEYLILTVPLHCVYSSKLIFIYPISSLKTWGWEFYQKNYSLMGDPVTFYILVFRIGSLYFTSLSLFLLYSSCLRVLTIYLLPLSFSAWCFTIFLCFFIHQCFKSGIPKGVDIECLNIW